MKKQIFKFFAVFFLFCVLLVGCSQGQEVKVVSEWPLTSPVGYSCDDFLANINYVANAKNVEKIACYYYDSEIVGPGEVIDHGKKEAIITDSDTIEKVQKCLRKAKYEETEMIPWAGNRYYYTAFYIDGKIIYIGGIEGDHIYCNNNNTWLKETKSTELSAIIYNLFEQE